jgi:hypothetical protein
MTAPNMPGFTAALSLKKRLLGMCRGRSDPLLDALPEWSLHSLSPLGPLIVRDRATWIITVIAFVHSSGRHRPTAHSGFDPIRGWHAHEAPF